jgi:L-fuculose-phosphate aldolase
MTPTSRDYRTLTERDLVQVDLESGRATGRWKPTSEWRLHVAIYQARSDINAIIHHHSTWASAVAVARKTIPVLLDEAADIGPIPTATYAPSASPELAEVVLRELGPCGNAVLLANHGVVVVGRHLAEAMRRALEVERLAKIYIGAEILGGAHPLEDADVSRNRAFFETYRAGAPDGEVAPDLVPSIERVHVGDVVDYSFRASLTFASLMYNLILQRPRQ